jgi:hypothetical protein
MNITFTAERDGSPITYLHSDGKPLRAEFNSDSIELWAGSKLVDVYECETITLGELNQWAERVGYLVKPDPLIAPLARAVRAQAAVYDARADELMASQGFDAAEASALVNWGLLCAEWTDEDEAAFHADQDTRPTTPNVEARFAWKLNRTDHT